MGIETRAFSHSSGNTVPFKNLSLSVSKSHTLTYLVELCVPERNTLA